MRTLAAIGVLAIIIVIGAAVFFFGGFYNVAASAPDPGIVNWALVKVRAASIDRRARFISPVNLDDPEIVRAGARAFSERGCTNCHGAPGANDFGIVERSEEHTSELQSHLNLVCRLLLEKKR